MQLAIPDMEVIERLHGDVIAYDTRHMAKGWKPWTLTDGTPSLIPSHWPITRHDDEWRVMDGARIDMRMPRDCYYFDRVEPPLADCTAAQLDKWTMPLYTDEELEYLARQSRAVYDETEYSVKYTLAASIYEGAHALRGNERFYIDLATDRGFAETLMEKLCEGNMKNFDLFQQAVGPRCDVIWVGDDLGTQRSLQISPQMYREMVFPRHRRIYQHIKRNSEFFIVLHSCGSIMPLLDDLIEAGIDGINPVQITADNMDPRTLKERFGDRLLFWGGGVDTQHVLQNGTPEQVRENVRQLCAAFKPGGGFVWNTIHNIQATVPPENIAAAYDAAFDFAAY
jgi:uroporphyrinogen decarboxylase